MQNKNGFIIVTGVGPMPIGNPEKVYAPGLRLFAFADVINNAGYNVIVGEAGFEKTQSGDNLTGYTGFLTKDSVTAYSSKKSSDTLKNKDGDALKNKNNFEKDKNNFSTENNIDNKDEIIREGIIRKSLPLDPVKAAEIISGWISKYSPAAIVSTTDVMNLASALLRADVPRWMDFNGHPMVERQEISFIHKSDLGIIDQWKYVVPALLTGDFFSSCSTPQKHALIGELGAVGRLNAANAGNDFVAMLRPGHSFHEKPQTGKPKILKGKIIPENAFCLLWTGGFNTWVDEVTLFKGVAGAMDNSDRIHFVLTGGAIKGHNEETFNNFKKLVENSPHKSRFHFMGWVPMRDLPLYYSESDAAILIDRFTYEALLGYRNRILSWMQYGIPMILTPVSEITAELVDKNLASGFSPGNHQRLSEILINMASDYTPYEIMALQAQKYLNDEFKNEKVLKALIDWIQHPKQAPDKKNAARVESGKYKGIKIPDNPLCKISLEMLEFENIKSELESVKNGRGYKVIQAIKKITGK